MILSTVRLAIPLEQRAEAVRMLRIFMGHATAAAGCVGVWLSQDLIDPLVLTISNRWRTRDDLDTHMASAEYRLLLAAVALSRIPPEICIDELEHIGGFDVVQALRTSGRPTATGDRS
jgi:quinol monooxygenase YgiN